jgi:hypothetical protein
MQKLVSKCDICGSLNDEDIKLKSIVDKENYESNSGFYGATQTLIRDVSVTLDICGNCREEIISKLVKDSYNKNSQVEKIIFEIKKFKEA